MAGTQERPVTDGISASSPEPAIRRIREILVYRNQFASIYDDEVAFADGREGRYLRVLESDGDPSVAILAVSGGRAALVRTYRYALGSWEWAIPRGFAHGGDPVVSAREELEEELGQPPADLIRIGAVTPNSGLIQGHVEILLATYAAPAIVPADTGEVAEIRWVPLSALYGEIASGQIQDAFTISALTIAHARRLIRLT
jgi:8-oxo-dGTP pyrophosphatase MutT (NUDIX family)